MRYIETDPGEGYVTEIDRAFFSILENDYSFAANRLTHRSAVIERTSHRQAASASNHLFPDPCKNREIFLFAAPGAGDADSSIFNSVGF